MYNSKKVFFVTALKQRYTTHASRRHHTNYIVVARAHAMSHDGNNLVIVQHQNMFCRAQACMFHTFGLCA